MCNTSHYQRDHHEGQQFSDLALQGQIRKGFVAQTMGEHREEKAYVEFLSGWGAAFINISVTFPINKIMFRQQLHGIHSFYALKQIKQDGIRNLYRGLLPPLLQKTTSVAIMFGTYHQYLNLLQPDSTPAHVSVKHISAALMAGCTEATLLPFERVQVLLQDAAYHKHFRNSFHALYELKAYGFSEYYRGLTAVLMRNGPSNALFFTLRGPIKEALPKLETELGNTFEDFISGAVLGAGLSTVFYPINVVKTRMQIKLGGEFVSFKETYKIVFNERKRSYRKLFRGVHLNYTRSLLSWGIINAAYEAIKKRLT